MSFRNYESLTVNYCTYVCISHINFSINLSANLFGGKKSQGDKMRDDRLTQMNDSNYKPITLKLIYECSLDKRYSGNSQ